MALLVPLLGTLASVVVAAAVYVDATRRGLLARSRTRWTAGVGLASLAGFLAAWRVDGALVRLVLRAVRGEPVAYGPREPLWITLAAGLSVAVVAVGLYRLGTLRPSAGAA